MAKYAETECYEEHGTVQESVTILDGMKASVVLRTPWEKRFILSNELLSDQAYPWPHTPLGWDKPFPINITMAADETDYTTDSDRQIIEYKDALLTVEYGYVDVSLFGDTKTRLTEQIEPYAEFLRLSPQGFRWRMPGDNFDPVEGWGATGELDPEEAPGLLFRGFSLVRQVYEVPFIHGSALTLPGSVNRNTYTSRILGFTFPPETLLFNPPSISRTFVRSGGTKGFNVTIKFNYKPQGWNRYWRADVGSWERIYTWRLGPVEGGGEGRVFDRPYYSYPLRDFSAWLW